MTRRFGAIAFAFGLVAVSCTSGSDDSAPDSTENPPTAIESVTTEPVAIDEPTTTGAATTTSDTAAPVRTSELAVPETAPSAAETSTAEPPSVEFPAIVTFSADDIGVDRVTDLVVGVDGTVWVVSGGDAGPRAFPTCRSMAGLT